MGLISRVSSRTYRERAKIHKNRMSGIRFEVFGKVQGVWFRKYTKKTADKLNLKGWCKNTDHGTVIGEAIGDANAINAMVEFLSKTGSPKSRIDNCDIEHVKPDRDYLDFSIIR